MYSEEIKKLIEIKKYIISVDDYFKICDTSKQINRVLYNNYNDTFNIWTNDNYYFKFKVKKIEKNK